MPSSAEELRALSEQRYPDQAFIDAAQRLVDQNIVAFDDDPVVNVGRAGGYVQCWIWIPNDELGG